MPRSFDEVMAEAGKRGLILNNLFQLRTLVLDKNTPARATGEWQANFHHGSGWHDFGRGMSAVDALEDALSRAKGEKGPENRPVPKTPPKPTTENIEEMF